MSDELRVVMLGKTGSGKSSLGNTLLGRGEVYPVARGLLSGTEKCQWADTTLPSGLNLQVTDTPGVCDTHREEEDVLNEIGKSMAVASPGPHVILMVFRADKRFTEEEHMAYCALTNLFGREIHDYMIVVFTGADEYGSTIEEQEAGVSKTLMTCTPRLKQILSDAGNRYMCVNNLAQEGDRRAFADKLVHMMQDLVMSNGRRHFSSKLCEQVQKVVEPLKQARKGSRLDTTRAVNQDIVAEGGIWDTIKEGLGELVKQAVKKAVDVVVGYVVKKCSVM